MACFYNYYSKAEPAFHPKGADIDTFILDRTMYVGAWVWFKVPDGEEKFGCITKIYGFMQVEVTVFVSPNHDILGGFPLLPEGTKECQMAQEIVQSRLYYKIPTRNIKKLIQAFKFKTIIQKNLDISGMEDVYFLRLREAESSDSLWSHEVVRGQQLLSVFVELQGAHQSCRHKP
jgi:hypothetical protein